MELAMIANGIYRGLATTSASSVGFGEIEMTVTDMLICYHFATGVGIRSGGWNRSPLRQLLPSEVACQFAARRNPERVVAYALDSEGLIFFFFDEEELEYAPKCTLQGFHGGSWNDITTLYTPQQVTAGLFEREVTMFEASYGDPGVVPRLRYNGFRG